MIKFRLFLIVLGIFFVTPQDDCNSTDGIWSDSQTMWSPELPVDETTLASGRMEDFNYTTENELGLTPTFFSSGEGLGLLRDAVSRAKEFADDLFDDFEPKLARKGN